MTSTIASSADLPCSLPVAMTSRSCTALVFGFSLWRRRAWQCRAQVQKACREDLSVVYHRASRLFAMLTLGRSDGRYLYARRRAGKVTFNGCVP